MLPHAGSGVGPLLGDGSGLAAEQGHGAPTRHPWHGTPEPRDPGGPGPPAGPMAA